MEKNILNTLQVIGYDIPEDQFQDALTTAPKSIEFSKIVHFITNELRSLSSIDEEVNVIAVPEDSVSFLMEVNSFLREIGCPHQCLSEGGIEDRLKTIEDKSLLLEYLSSKLLLARMQKESKPDKKIILKVQETPEAKNLQTILSTLNCSKETTGLPLKEILDVLTLRLETIVTECGKDLLCSPIWNHQLSELQWDELNNVAVSLHDEYTIRRKMMLQRLDCTIQSFQWSDKMKDKGELIMKTYTEKRKQLKVEPDVDVSSLLAARDDLAIIEKTSNSSVRKNTQSNINKVMIGKVPDRGGRTSEQAVPAPEMPSWQARQAGGGGRGGGRGGGGRGGGYNRGGHVQHGGGQQHYQDNRQKQQNFDSAGSYTTPYHHNQGNRNNYQNNGHQQQQQQQYGNQRYEEQYQNDPKRPRTYDSFQTQRQTYADQYVQESQSNQQYQPRQNRGGGGRGRSNYHRGGRGGGGGYGQGQNYY